MRRATRGLLGGRRLRFSSLSSSSPAPVVVSEEVRDALRLGKPVVALESTILTHGLPYPENLAMAKKVEGRVRERGAIPATIALARGGRPCVGLSDEDLESLASSPNPEKISAKDLGFCVAKRKNGGTTVAGTMALASLAGIRVFATGGLGGVHRGGEVSMDVSADLEALSKYPVAVVCSGIKSILDVRKSLEVLETHSVPVFSYRCTEFPAFYSSKSSVTSPRNATGLREVAQAFYWSQILQRGCGLVLAAPPPESGIISEEEIEKAIRDSLTLAERAGVSGAEVTPMVLANIHKLTGGRSVDLNVNLVEHNATLAADLALELKRFTDEENNRGCSHFQASAISESERCNQVAVVGGSVVDWVATPDSELVLHSSTPGSLRQSFGGVGRNIAEGLARLGSTPILISSVASDVLGQAIIQGCKGAGVNTSSMIIISHPNRVPTASYLAVATADGDLHCAVADMAIHDEITESELNSRVDSVFSKCRFVVADCNLATPVLQRLAMICTETFNAPALIVEPTSVPKSLKITGRDILPEIDLISPNIIELKAVRAEISDQLGPFDLQVVQNLGGDETNSGIVKECGEVLFAMHGGAAGAGKESRFTRGKICHESGSKYIIVTLGEQGALLVSSLGPPAEGKLKVETRLFPSISVPASEVKSTSGAGDALIAGVVHGLAAGLSVAEALPAAVQFASEAVRTHQTVPSAPVGIWERRKTI